MLPVYDHSLFAWLLIIGAVCLTIAIGAAIDRYFINRRIKVVARRVECTQHHRRSFFQ